MCKQEFKQDRLQSEPTNKQEFLEPHASPSCAMVALALGILSFFTGAFGILLGAIGLGCGMSSRNNKIGMSGFIVSAIASIFVIIKVTATTLMLNHAH